MYNRSFWKFNKCKNRVVKKRRKKAYSYDDFWPIKQGKQHSTENFKKMF